MTNAFLPRVLWVLLIQSALFLPISLLPATLLTTPSAAAIGCWASAILHLLLLV
jgi:hypothetical protein